MGSFAFADLLIGVGVLLVLEGLMFAASPTWMRQAMKSALQTPDNVLRAVGLASAVGAVAGIMVAHIVYLDPNMMGGILLYAFASALVGGISNPAGAVAGGFVNGLLITLLAAFLATIVEDLGLPPLVEFLVLLIA